MPLNPAWAEKTHDIFDMLGLTDEVIVRSTGADALLRECVET